LQWAKHPGIETPNADFPDISGTHEENVYSILLFGYRKQGNGKIIPIFSIARREMRFEAEGSLGEGVWRRAWTETGKIRNEGRCWNAQESLRSLEEGDREASLPAPPPPIVRESERARI
jgi:hypothetical protein